MEKLIYPVWKRAGDSVEAFSAGLRGPAAEALLAAGARHVRIGIVDATVAPAAPLRIINSQPVIDGVISLWVDTAVWRERYEAAFRAHVGHFHGYLVCESEPIVSAGRHPANGERLEGMSQVVFLQRPPRLSREDWLTVWQGSHTQVAIDTQSTWGYRQNVVMRALTYSAPHYDAIVEENFPIEAMTSQHAFYAAGDDDALYRANLKAMMDSCARFIDMDKIDCIPTSEYNWHA